METQGSYEYERNVNASNNNTVDPKEYGQALQAQLSRIQQLEQEDDEQTLLFAMNDSKNYKEQNLNTDIGEKEDNRDISTEYLNTFSIDDLFIKGNEYFDTGDLTKSLIFYEKTVEKAKEQYGEYSIEVYLYNNVLFMVYVSQGDKQNTSKIRNNNIEIARKMGEGLDSELSKLQEKYKNPDITEQEIKSIQLSERKLEKRKEKMGKLLRYLENSSILLEQAFGKYKFKLTEYLTQEQGKQIIEPIEEILGNRSVKEEKEFLENMRAMVVLGIGDYQKALRLYTDMMKREEREATHNFASASTYYALGDIYYQLGEYDKALSFYEKDRIISEEKESGSINLSTTYNAIGLLYYEQWKRNQKGELLEKSLEMFDESIEIMEKKREERNIVLNFPPLVITYYNKARVLKELNKTKDSLDTVNESIDVNNSGVENSRKEAEIKYAYSQNLKGEILREIGKGENEGENLTDVRDFFIEAVEQNSSYLNALINLGEISIEILQNPNTLSGDEKDKYIKTINAISEKIKDLPQTNYKKKVKEQYLARSIDEKSETEQILKELLQSENVEYLVEGIIQSKLADMVYIKDQKEFQKELQETFGNNFNIVAFSNETGNENGFYGVCLERNDKKYFIFRGTDFKSLKELYRLDKVDFVDIIADVKIFAGFLPGGQIEDMVDFVNRNMKKGEKVYFAGHSLGGNLAQIATTMYPENVENGYAFNAPGAKDLTYIELFFDKKYRSELKGYGSNRISNTKVLNYDSDESIGKYKEDIGFHPFPIRNQNHGIIKANKDLIENYINNVNLDIEGKRYTYTQILKLSRILNFQNKYYKK